MIAYRVASKFTRMVSLLFFTIWLYNTHANSIWYGYGSKGRAAN